jgi:predicted AlkP superfamily pyrophosphatase or phosphodiesterase
MRIRPLIFLSALSFMLLGLAGGLRAQQQDAGPVARRVIIFVWDGLPTDDPTPEITPNYFALARSGVVFADHHAAYPTFTASQQFSRFRSEADISERLAEPDL